MKRLSRGSCLISNACHKSEGGQLINIKAYTLAGPVMIDADLNFT